MPQNFASIENDYEPDSDAPRYTGSRVIYTDNPLLPRAAYNERWFARECDAIRFAHDLPNLHYIRYGNGAAYTFPTGD